MSTFILNTKIYIPALRSNAITRPRLVEKLHAGLLGKLTLISAPAGFGKTTLVSEWISMSEHAFAWVSLDEGDNDPARFLTYIIIALQSIVPDLGKGMLGALQAAQQVPNDTLLTALINDIAATEQAIVLVLDDYHVIDSQAVDSVLRFLLDQLPPHIHLVITTREDPNLPLARLRARGQLNELRADDLRFTIGEAREFLLQVMDIQLTTDNLRALDKRTEGWIAGLQLAAISMRGHDDIEGFIQSFTGSHYFVMDYLIEEVLHQQVEDIHNFLLSTSILDRLCAPLCDAVLEHPPGVSQQTLTELHRSNLFIIPLDNERQWFRYHHLFADLLQQRLHSHLSPQQINALHQRASDWYHANHSYREAFHHAVAANDLERIIALIEGDEMPLHFKGVVMPVLAWLEAQPQAVLDAHPVLWVMYASVLLFVGHMSAVVDAADCAEAVLKGLPEDAAIRDLIGHIASIRAALAVSQNEVDTILTQSHRALDYLAPDNLPVRTATTWTLGVAQHILGDREAAKHAYREALKHSQAIGHHIITTSTMISLANIQEADNELRLAAQAYKEVLSLAGDPPMPIICEAYIGLARIAYEWNDLEIAEYYAQKSIELASQLENTDRYVLPLIFLAQVRLAQADILGTDRMLTEAEQFIRQNQFMEHMPAIIRVRILLLIKDDDLTTVAQLAETYDLPLSMARVHLMREETKSALDILDEVWREVKAKKWADEQLKVMVLYALTWHVHGDDDKALQWLHKVLMIAVTEGLIRTFLDEGQLMAALLAKARATGMTQDVTTKLLNLFEPSGYLSSAKSDVLIEPLTDRELEVLQLVSNGLSNREISERLFLALDTVKGHNRRIYAKLNVQRRTEAVARARELGLFDER